MAGGNIVGLVGFFNASVPYRFFLLCSPYHLRYKGRPFKRNSEKALWRYIPPSRAVPHLHCLYFVHPAARQCEGAGNVLGAKNKSTLGSAQTLQRRPIVAVDARETSHRFLIVVLVPAQSLQAHTVHTTRCILSWPEILARFNEKYSACIMLHADVICGCNNLDAVFRESRSTG